LAKACRAALVLYMVRTSLQCMHQAGAALARFVRCPYGRKQLRRKVEESTATMISPALRGLDATEDRGVRGTTAYSERHCSGQCS